MEESTAGKSIGILFWIICLAAVGLVVYSSWEARWVYLALAALVMLLIKEKGRLQALIDSYQAAFAAFKEETEKQFRGADRRLTAIEENLREISDRLGRIMLEPQALPVPAARSRAGLWFMGAVLVMVGAGFAYAYMLQRELRSEWGELHASARRDIEALQGRLVEAGRVNDKVRGEMGLMSEVLDSITKRRCDSYDIPLAAAELTEPSANAGNCICINERERGGAAVWNAREEHGAPMASLGSR